MGSFIVTFEKFYIQDLILVIITEAIGFGIRFSHLKITDELYINPSPSEYSSTTTLSYPLICVMNYLIGTFAVVMLYINNKLDHRIFGAVYSYLFSITLTTAITAVLGKALRCPKPDTLTICQGESTILGCSKYLSDSQFSSQFNSLPSYHAAESMAAGLFLALYFYSFSNEFSLILSTFALLPLAYAFFVSFSRVWDRQNSISDVLCGMFIGGIVAYISFTTYKRGVKKVETSEKLKRTQVETSAILAPKYV